MKSAQEKLSALFPGLDRKENRPGARQEPREKPLTERMRRQLAGEPLDDQIIDPANPNLIKRE